MVKSALKAVMMTKLLSTIDLTITSQGPRTLLLTTPECAVIQMDRRRTMFINLMVRGRTDICFAQGSLYLNEPSEPDYHENKSLTLNGYLGNVEVSYTCMPFAQIANVRLIFTQQGQDKHFSDTSSSPDGHISGEITAHYTSHIGGSPPPPLILFHKEHDQVHYGVPVNEQVDICGTVAVRYSQGTCYLFKADNARPMAFIGKAPTLVGLTSYPGECFKMVVRLNDVGKKHVYIKNCFALYDFDLSFPGLWFNRPFCHILLGKQGFAAVHFILFESAVKATVKISVVLKDPNASCPSGSVNGTLVARYSKYKYLTKYQRKYWSIDLLQVKDKQSLLKDGEISLLRDVVSVPKGSSLILDADLYVSSGSAGTCVGHFRNKVKIKIGDGAPSRIEGQTCDVVVSTKWESGLSL